jgi:TetR/AcrR family transcriptional regulator
MSEPAVPTEESIDDAILGKALLEFETFGIRKSNVDDVANAAGVSRSTLYRRFPSKNALLRAVGQRVLTETLSGVDKATRGFPPQSVVVEAFCTLATSLHSIPFYRAVLMVNEVGKTMSVIREVRRQGMTEMAARVVTTLQRAGSTMPAEELNEVSHLLVRVAAALVEDPIPGVPPDDEQAIRRFATVHLAKLVR